MFIEFVELFRCPRPHEESYLVASSDQVDGRDIVHGLLGCPVCRAEYPIIEGIAHFEGDETVVRPEATSANDNDAIRLAAFLAFDEPAPGVTVLLGAWGNSARGVLGITDVQLLLVNPPRGATMGDGLSGITIAGPKFPLARASARGVALDRSAGSDLALSATEILRPRGRLVAPVSVPLPEGVTELARDDELAVAERVGTELHALRRR